MDVLVRRGVLDVDLLARSLCKRLNLGRVAISCSNVRQRQTGVKVGSQSSVCVARQIRSSDAVLVLTMGVY